MLLPRPARIHGDAMPGLDDLRGHGGAVTVSYFAVVPVTGADAALAPASGVLGRVTTAARP